MQYTEAERQQKINEQIENASRIVNKNYRDGIGDMEAIVTSTRFNPLETKKETFGFRFWKTGEAFVGMVIDDNYGYVSTVEAIIKNKGNNKCQSR